MGSDELQEHTIRKAVDAVFRSPAYNRTSPMTRFWSWLAGMILRLWHWISPGLKAMSKSPPLYWGVIITIGVLVAAAVARWIYLWRARAALEASGGWSHQAGILRGDAWAAAQQLAARGDYTAAAHALYSALLDASARQQQIKIHPSKTAGDYVREVRRRSSPMFPRFRDFARAYELVIYGLGECDAERYERLRALAMPIVQPNV